MKFIVSTILEVKKMLNEVKAAGIDEDVTTLADLYRRGASEAEVEAFIEQGRTEGTLVVSVPLKGVPFALSSRHYEYVPPVVLSRLEPNAQAAPVGLV